MKLGSQHLNEVEDEDAVPKGKRGKDESERLWEVCGGFMDWKSVNDGFPAVLSAIPVDSMAEERAAARRRAPPG